MDGDLNGDFLTAIGLEDVPEARAALIHFGSTRSEPDWFRRLGASWRIVLTRRPTQFSFSLRCCDCFPHTPADGLIGRFEQDERLLPDLLLLLSSGRQVVEALCDVPELVGTFQTQNQREPSFAELVAKFDLELSPLIGVSGAMRGAGLALRRQYQRERLRICTQNLSNISILWSPDSDCPRWPMRSSKAQFASFASS